MEANIIQIITSMIASTCFAVIFDIKGKKLVWIAAISGIGWTVYLLCTDLGYGVLWGLFWSSLSISLMSEISARAVKTPVILFLSPTLIPEFPGRDLYYSMFYLVRHSYADFFNMSDMVLLEAGAIALGIIIASCAARLAQSFTSGANKKYDHH